MIDHIFRQYDIRGIVGSELIISEVYSLAQSIAYYFKEHMPDMKAVAVGADGRVHSPVITTEVCRGLQESGLEVIFIGICPTPMLYFALHTLSVDAGLMITASHNPQEYNGIKIMLGTEPVWGAQIQVIKEYYKQKKHISKQGGSYKENLLVDAYVSWLVQHFPLLKNVQLQAILDAGHGATGIVLPKLCEKMEWTQVKILYAEVDGSYPHHTPDPTVEENMKDVQQLLRTTEYEIGIGFDGDGDRMGAVTKAGKLVLGDKLLAIFANDIRASYPHATIVYDLKCSSGLRELLQLWGMKSHITPTGSAWVRQYLQQYHAPLGGELSCHLFFNDRYFGYDDGIYAMLRLFEIMVKTGKSLEQLISIFPHKVSSHEIRFEYPQGKQDSIIEHVLAYFKSKKVDILTIDGVYVTFKHGWGIIRISHTQPVLSIRFEADTEAYFKEIQSEIIESLTAFFERSFLKKMLS